jgi:carbon storage regulator
MLVLTRKSNQSIMIGDDIEISVLSIMGEKVRIGIQAPRDIPVFRNEVYLEIQEERARVSVAATGPSEGDGDAVDAGRSLREEVDRELRQLGGR